MSDSDSNLDPIAVIPAIESIAGKTGDQKIVVVTLAVEDERPLVGSAGDKASELRRRNDIRVARFQTFLGTLADVDPDAAIVSPPSVFPVVSVRVTDQAILRIRLETDLVSAVEDDNIDFVPDG